jgi:hypothetical protein
MNTLNTTVLSVFGREVTYVPQLGAPVPVRAVSGAPHQAEDASPGTYTVLFLRVADLSQPPERGDEVRIGDSTYKVFEIEADADGGVRLSLRLT